MRTRWGAVAAMGTVLAGLGAVGSGTVAPLRVAAATSTWTNSATGGPAAEQGAAMAWDAATGSDVLLTTGGQTWTWDGSAWTQLSPAHSPGARVGAAMAYDANHAQVVLFGGLLNGAAQQDTWTWNGSDWTQRAPSNSPPWRAGASVAWDGNSAGGGGYVLMFGGFNSPGVFYDDTWQWDGGNWNEQIANVHGAGVPSPSPRTQAMMSNNGANKTVVLFGGTNPQGVLGDTWVWADSDVSVGTTHTIEGHWIPVTPTQSPPARAAGTLAFGAGSGDVRFGGPILFGGASAAGLLQDTWSFDGSGWSQASPGGQPPARTEAVAAAGPGGTVVLFGGRGTSGVLSDTWTWSGSIDAAPPPAPTTDSCPPVTAPTPLATSGTGTLRGAAAQSHPGLYVGAALTAAELYDADAEQQSTAASQFNMIASSNQMWWSGVENEPYVFDFCHADQFVGYAQANHQALTLHNLIASHDALGMTPNWVVSPTLPWTATSLSAVMKQYISTYVAHMRGKVAAIDVAGETTNPDGSAVPNVFSSVIGFPRYVEEAFQDADAANPQAILYYDDVHDWYAPELQVVENLVTDLHNTGSRIDAVGMEFFAAGGDDLSRDVAGAMATLAAAPYNVKTAVTQMTVPWYSTTEPAATDGFWTTQASVYQHVLSACLAPASNCFMFMTWGVSDTYAEPTSALSPTAGVGGTLFDPTYQPRKAFAAVLGELQ